MKPEQVLEAGKVAYFQAAAPYEIADFARSARVESLHELKAKGSVMEAEPLDHIPLWCLFLLATCLSILGVELGYRFGRWRHKFRSDEHETPVAAMVASILGLLAFMLAFTFSMAASRFDARRQAVLEEANAIETTYLRTQLLPEPHRSETARLLREYTDLRVHKLNIADLPELITKSNELHKQLWLHAVAAAETAPHSITTGLFLQSLNETIDIHSKRIFVGLLSRVPLPIWLSLWSLTLTGMVSIGYQAGLSGTSRSPEMAVLSFAFGLVLLLNIDLDRGQEGLLRVGQQSMVDVLENMQRNAP